MPKPIITEKLLQYIWQFQYFNNKQLHLTNGDAITILSLGKPNTNQGTDFSFAKIIIGNTTLVGNIEIHINASDWYKHKHTYDAAYQQIILHVVWKNDKQVSNAANIALPTLEISPYVPNLLLQHYSSLQQQQVQFIPCEKFLPVLSTLSWLAWIDRLAAERLSNKAAYILKLYEQSNNNWEVVLWWMLARWFGGNVNADAFEQIARSLPQTLLAKYRMQGNAVEALLMGQAGLLNKQFIDIYPQQLQTEYQFLSKKHSLVSIAVPPKFLRMHPANFPTIRLSQLANLINQSVHLFSKIIEVTNIQELSTLIQAKVAPYWLTHYTFDTASVSKEKKLGYATIQQLIINTICPVLFAYGDYKQINGLKENALAFLQALPAEINHITKQWKLQNIEPKNALESQALIELYKHYCAEKRCLACAVGNAIMRKGE